MGTSSPRGTFASPRASGAGDSHKVLEKKIIDECTKNKKMWEDPDFPAAPGSLYRKLAASMYHPHQFLSILLSNERNFGFFNRCRPSTFVPKITLTKYGMR